jgi:hypothetical protein
MFLVFLQVVSTDAATVTNNDEAPLTLPRSSAHVKQQEKSYETVLRSGGI